MVYHKIPRSKATLKEHYTPYRKNMYMLTIQKHRKLEFVAVDDLFKVLQHLFSSIDSFRVLDHSFEVGDEYHQLHFHGLISSGWFRYMDYKTFLGFKLTWKPMTNLMGCLNYIYKDTDKKAHLQDEIVALNHFCHKKAPYAFI